MKGLSKGQCTHRHTGNTDAGVIAHIYGSSSGRLECFAGSR